MCTYFVKHDVEREKNCLHNWGTNTQKETCILGNVRWSSNQKKKMESIRHEQRNNDIFDKEANEKKINFLLLFRKQITHSIHNTLYVQSIQFAWRIKKHTYFAYIIFTQSVSLLLLLLCIFSLILFLLSFSSTFVIHTVVHRSFFLRI